MEFVIEFISNYLIEISFISIILILILFIIIMVQGIKIKKVRKKYLDIVRGIDGIDMESLLIQTGEEIEDLKGQTDSIKENINNIETKLSFCISKVGFIRYNAFDNVGSELSFSIVLLDEFQNGFIISNIYARDYSNCYSKEVRNGESKTPLSAEEILALERAIRGKESVLNM